MSGRIVQIDGCDVAVGLDWHRAGVSFVKLPFAFSAAGQGRVELMEWRASTDDLSFLTVPPLIQFIAPHIEEGDHYASVVVGFNDGTAWRAHFKGARAIMDTERLFESHNVALQDTITANLSLHREIYVYGLSRDLCDGLDVRQIKAPLISMVALGQAVAITPVRSISRRALLWSAALVVIAIGTLQYLPSLIEERSVTTAVTSEPEVVHTEWYLTPENLLKGCLSAHAQEWPRALGWNTNARGCDAPQSGSEDIYAWQIQHPLTNAQTGNAEPARILRARMASFMYQTWPFEKSISETTARASRRIEVDWIEAAEHDQMPTREAVVTLDGATRAAFSTALEDAFAGVLNDISVISIPREDNTSEGLVRLSISARLSPDEVAERIAPLRGISLQSVTWNADQFLELVLDNQPQIVARPKGVLRNAY